MTRTISDSLTRIGARLRSGEISSLDLVESSLAAVKRDGARTNAFIRVHAESARAAAMSADAERRANSNRGPLHGIPVSLKDLIDEAGIPTTAASLALDDRVPATDAPLVARLRHAGAIILGRTNLHEFALGTTSEDSGFGPVRNPYDESRVAGGSSGGSAVAVATGMGLASIGTDTGGSIRIPAAACGVVGLKPSIGDIPTAGIVPLSRTLDHAGPLALSVQDAASLWQVMANRAPATIAAVQPRGMRLTQLVGYFDSPVEAPVRAAFGAALDRLRDAGVVFGTAEVAGTDRIAPAYVDIALAEAAQWHAPYLDSRRERYQPTVHARISHGRTISAVAYLDARAVCTEFAAQVSALLESCDALVLPTLPVTAPLMGQADIVVEGAGGPVPVRAAMLKHTQLFNLTGHPAVSLPLATSSLPVGLQLVGRLGQTEQLLSIAAACERVLGANARLLSA